MKINTTKVQLAMADECMTMNELVEKSGVSRESITKMFNGTRNPKPATIGKLAKALNTKAELLLLEENRKGN